MYLVLLFQLLSLIVAGISAWLWFKASAIKFPEKFSFSVVKSDPMGQSVGATHIGSASCPGLEELAQKLKDQGNLNKQAAFFTAIYLILQIIAILLAQFF